jgi:hypothetical protein
LFFVHLKKKNEFTAKAECTAAGKEKTRAKTELYTENQDSEEQETQQVHRTFC